MGLVKKKKRRRNIKLVTSSLVSPGGSDSKESTCNAGDLGLIPGLGRSPGGGHGNPFQNSCLENPHGQKNLAGYSPWCCKESDTTERLRMHSSYKRQRHRRPLDRVAAQVEGTSETDERN